MTPTGKIYKTDKRGNFIVRSRDTTMPTVLDQSKGNPYKIGDSIYFEIYKMLDHVYLSRKYESLTKKQDMKDMQTDGKTGLELQSRKVIFSSDYQKYEGKKRNDNGIEWVFHDSETGQILIIGKWDSAPVSGDWHGSICGKKYIFLAPNATGFYYANSNPREISERLGIEYWKIYSDSFRQTYGTKSLLSFAHEKEGPEKAKLERFIETMLCDVV